MTTEHTPELLEALEALMDYAPLFSKDSLKGKRFKEAAEIHERVRLAHLAIAKAQELETANDGLHYLSPPASEIQAAHESFLPNFDQ